MGVEFQLGHNDHKTVEDFLLRRPTGVAAVTVHAKAARHQQGATEAARAAGCEVFFNPATERLVAPGYELPGCPYFPATPYDVDKLSADPAARAHLIETVVTGHPGFVSTITAPHFFVDSPRAASLNMVLAADTALSTDLPVRAVLVLDRRFGIKNAADLALQYSQTGITRLELRLSPLGGEDESLAKIKSAYLILDALRNAGLATTLGLSGTIGHAAVAFGHTDHYSVGVGPARTCQPHLCNQHAATTTQVRRERQEKTGGGGDGVYLPGIAQTVSRSAAEALLGHSDIRLRLGCRLEGCATSVAGPTTDPRRHYLHIRAQEMDDLLQRPVPWRPTMETERLSKALALRELINDRYHDGLKTDLKTRTLRSLVDMAKPGSTVRPEEREVTS